MMKYIFNTFMANGWFSLWLNVHIDLALLINFSVKVCLSGGSFDSNNDFVLKGISLIK